MNLMKEFEANIEPLNDELGRMLGINPMKEIDGLVATAKALKRKHSGIKSIEVREIHTEDDIEVTRYIKCLNPYNEELFLTEQEIAEKELLGLSVRRA